MPTSTLLTLPKWPADHDSSPFGSGQQELGIQPLPYQRGLAEQKGVESFGTATEPKNMTCPLGIKQVNFAQPRHNPSSHEQFSGASPAPPSTVL